MLATSAASTSLAGVVVGLAVLVLMLYRQVQVRPFRGDRNQTLLLVLLVIGLAQVVTYLRAHHTSGAHLAIAAASIVVIGGGLGAVRAYTVRVWSDGGQILRQGTWVTVALWIVAVGSHLALDQVDHLAGASVLLYLGVTLGAQLLVLRNRVGRMGLDAAAPS